MTFGVWGQHTKSKAVTGRLYIYTCDHDQYHVRIHTSQSSQSSAAALLCPIIPQKLQLHPLGYISSLLLFIPTHLTPLLQTPVPRPRIFQPANPRAHVRKREN
jgi:hypothetical protein